MQNPSVSQQNYAHIIGWGMYVPNTVLTNDDLAAILDTSDDWIRSRTGIRERRIAGERESTSQLALKAAQNALKITDVLPSEIDLIIVATSTPEYIFPSTASLIQHWLGASNAGAFDLSAACSGFVYGVNMAAQAIRSGSITTAVVIGAETMSRVMNWQDRSTSILFGDGAGAVVLQQRSIKGGILATSMHSDGSGYDLLAIPTEAAGKVRAPDGIGDPKMHKMYMIGSEVFKFATRVVAESIRESVERANLKLTDIDLIVPHQANERILQAAARSLGVEYSHFVSNLDTYGNTSAASIPIALCEAVDQGRIKPGDNIVLVGFGGGLAWGSIVVTWGMHLDDTTSISRLREQRRQAGYALIRFRMRMRQLSRQLRRFFNPFRR